MLAVAYEGTNEVKVVNKNSLNRCYKDFFQMKNESLTQVFNRFILLMNDIRYLKMHKKLKSPWFSSFLT